jgi:Na+-transporting NADH:ubiquinone oxidoreductase subunit C
MSKRQVLELVKQRIDRSETIRDPETGWETTLIKAYETDAHRRLIGYGFSFRGLGFWAPIEGILAVTPDMSETIGIKIVQQSETPGLGGRITEPVFTEQFRKGVLVSPREGGDTIVVGADGGDNPRHVDAITGATQTSMAMERILNEALARFQRAMAARGSGGDRG